MHVWPNPMISLIALFPAVILAAALLLPLLWSRNGLLLGVHVAPEFLATAAARRIRRNYIAGSVALGLSGIAASLAGIVMSRPSLWIVAEIAEILGLFLLMIYVVTTLRPHRAKNPVRSAPLSPEPSHPGWVLSMLAAFLPLAGVAALLASRWQTLPSRFPIHWGIDGHPNGWSTRSIGGVFAPIFLGAAVILLLMLTGALVSRSSPVFAGRQRFLRLNLSVIRAAAWLLAVVFSSVSLLPLTSNPTRLMPWFVLGFLVFATAMAAYVVIRARGLSGDMAAAQDSTPDNCWKAGVFYFNPGDPALMVPKRTGFGYTMNFARPMAWVFLGGLILIPLLFPLLLRMSGKH